MTIKKFLLGLSFIPLAVGGGAHAHSGYSYVGLGIGASHSNMAPNTQISGLRGGDTYSVSQYSRLSTIGMIGQLEVGHLKSFSSSSFMIGEAFFRGPGNTAQGTGTYLDNSGNVMNLPIKTSLKRNYSGGVSAKFGKDFESSNWGAFVSVGALFSQFDIKQSCVGTLPSTGFVVNTSSSKKRTAWGVAPGVGLTYNGFEKMALRFSYACEMYQSIKSGIMQAIEVGGDTMNASSKISPVYHTFIVSLGYKF